MTFIEIMMAIIAASMLAIGVSVVVAVSRVLPLVRRADTTLKRTNSTLARVQNVASELERVSQDARVLERRVVASVHGLLDQIEPPMRILSGVLAGARSGIAALISRKTAGIVPQSTQPTGVGHER